MAEGVRNYNLETWKQIVGSRGIELICENMTHFCEYYIQQGQADNHAVREAACHCISELCEKVASVQPDPMRPFVDDLLACLIDCFKDESWPVRDSACVSTGKFVKTFPEESSP